MVKSDLFHYLFYSYMFRGFFSVQFPTHVTNLGNKSLFAPQVNFRYL